MRLPQKNLNQQFNQRNSQKLSLQTQMNKKPLKTLKTSLPINPQKKLLKKKLKLLRMAKLKVIFSIKLLI